MRSMVSTIDRTKTASVRPTGAAPGLNGVSGAQVLPRSRSGPAANAPGRSAASGSGASARGRWPSLSSVIPLESIPTPPIPRLPLVPDPLRRIRVPSDLGAVTARSHEVADVEALGMTASGIERIWGGVERLYRSGMYPAIALCVRRHGQVVLDRAIGHARGNGPSDREDAARTPATPETPFVIYSASKAMTAVVA